MSLAFHPSEARDADGAATALLRQVLIETSLAPLAWIDLERTVALRMDDPGAAQNVHLRTWRYRQLDGDAWQRIGAALDARAARLSVAYVCGWVDDGDPARGSLEVRGRPARRTPGRVHRSADVVYREVAGDAPARVHDYRGQFAALRSLRRQGSVDVELHGYTHMHPDRSRWARAADRYDAVDWYRELGAAAQRSLVGTAPEAHPLALGAGCIERSFGAAPSTLVCPGDQWTDEALGVALDLGLRAVSSYYFALRHDDRFCWCQHVCAPYLDEVDAAWLDSPLPLVGYFHDRDVALHGVGWLERALDRWREAGARRFVTLRDLALASGATLDIGGDGVLELRCAGPVASAGSLPVRVRIPGTPRPQRIAFRRAAAPGQRSDEALPLTAAGDGVFGLPLADGARRGGRGPMTVSKR